MNKNVCRICMAQGLLMSIYKKIGLSVISTKIMSLAKIQIKPEDGLPDTICTKCFQKLSDCLEFIQLCENSDLKLRSLLMVQCDDGKLILDDDKCTLINAKFAFDCENTLSPKSEVLLIDESVDHSVQTLLPDTAITDGIKFAKEDKNQSRESLKKTQKQQCFTCGKVMSSRFRLKTHLRTHTGERPFSCPHCSKNFSLAQNLKVHLRIHTGEKPLQCTVCGESFAHSAGLATHKRKHTGQTPYQCMLCPRSFRTVGHLQYHTRRHTGEKNFECDTCGRAFITRSDLKQHLLTHTGDRPHVCCICGLRLTRASHLKRHMQLTHTGKTFSCCSCPAKFNKKTDLEKHMKRHGNVKETDSSRL